MKSLSFLIVGMIYTSLVACIHQRPYRSSSQLERSYNPQAIDLSKWRSPLEGAISSNYGPRDGDGLFQSRRFHHGIDIRAKSGTKIRAVYSGRVIFSGWKKGFGRLVIVDHGELHSYYAHCQSLHVKRGDWVDKGQWLARVGSSGRSTGPHLHFEIRSEVSGKSFDPLAVFKASEPAAISSR